MIRSLCEASFHRTLSSTMHKAPETLPVLHQICEGVRLGKCESASQTRRGEWEGKAADGKESGAQVGHLES